ncbi:MAG: glutamate racemase [Acidimicrobiia bacterium]
MIGVFDSGVGGLWVLNEVRKLLPSADLIYVADRLHAPYGTRSLDEVRHLSHEIAGWLIDRGATTLVVACNTASAAALSSLRIEHPSTPIVGMEPAVKPAALSSRNGVIAVFATEATFQGRLYETVVNRHAPGVEIIQEACPEWVELVEEGATVGERAIQVVRAKVQPAVQRGADSLVLACTHFSFLTGLIRDAAGTGVSVVDPAAAVARQTARVVDEAHGSGRVDFAVSGDVSEFEQLRDELIGIRDSQPALPFP